MTDDQRFCATHGVHHSMEMSDPDCAFEDGLGSPIEVETATMTKTRAASRPLPGRSIVADKCASRHRPGPRWFQGEDRVVRCELPSWHRGSWHRSSGFEWDDDHAEPEPSDSSEAASGPLWCADETPHREHWRTNEFGGRDYCTGRSAPVVRGVAADGFRQPACRHGSG